MPSLLVTFLTGQSDPGRNALSPEQAAFLASLALAPAEMLALNFPWDAATLPHREVSLARASVANASQFLRAPRASFEAKHRGVLDPLLARADHVVFLAGSCGLELLRGLSPPPAVWPRLHVIAYGPVARARPHFDCHLVGGRRDPVSRVFFRETDTVVDADHMGYLRTPAMRDAALAFIARVRGLAGSEAR